jgi:hypothetical protein
MGQVLTTRMSFFLLKSTLFWLKNVFVSKRNTFFHPKFNSKQN